MKMCRTQNVEDNSDYSLNSHTFYEYDCQSWTTEWLLYTLSTGRKTDRNSLCCGSSPDCGESQL